ncbi:MAG: MSHA biosis protein MshG [Magnetococcales bacterium]|nr:MSHA biosis protein MshG [Magnetococcales bacterium]HIJ84945.1 type II secretion system F family protein [Magnetococcales bacterium]
MPEYRYVGRNADGSQINGVLRTQSEGECVSQLRHRKIIPLKISLAQNNQGKDAIKIDFSRKTPPKIQDLIQFSRQMNALVGAGVPIVKSLQGICDITHNIVFAEALALIITQLQAGKSFSATLRDHPKIFPVLFVNMIHIGEETGRLADAFNQLYRYYEVEEKTRKQIKSALRYPKIVFSAIFSAMFALNYFVIPVFAKMFSKMGSELPMATKILIATSTFTKNYWYIVIGGWAAIIFGFMHFIKTPNGRLWWDRQIMTLPLIGPVIHQAVLARFARTFAMASGAGVPILETLIAISKAVDNAYVAKVILEMRSNIERGESLTQVAQASNLFTPLVLQMIAVGEETGSLDAMMLNVADFYEKEVEFAVEALSAGIEPIMLVFIGIIITVMALGIFLPLATMGTSMMHK